MSNFNIPVAKKPMASRAPESLFESTDEYNKIIKKYNSKLLFSFKFLELRHEAFNLGGVCTNWVNDLFEFLIELSKTTRNDFVNSKARHYRSHTHKWSELQYKYNLDDDFLEQVETRQARISTSKGGIHGFLIGNRFYIVWLDPHHNLYPDDRYGGLKIFEPPMNCCDFRNYRINELENESKLKDRKIEELEDLLDIKTSP